uniref:Uncharacterized protein n=1 Tax=Amphimedon queenslandica TaxID=400682 RepID=A0A1X7UWF0_AMPQE
MAKAVCAVYKMMGNSTLRIINQRPQHPYFLLEQLSTSGVYSSSYYLALMSSGTVGVTTVMYALVRRRPQNDGLLGKHFL